MGQSGTLASARLRGTSDPWRVELQGLHKPRELSASLALDFHGWVLARLTEAIREGDADAFDLGAGGVGAIQGAQAFGEEFEFVVFERPVAGDRRPQLPGALRKAGRSRARVGLRGLLF